MMKTCVLLCLGCALVAVIEGQDMTSMMFQAMGMEPPLLPPSMPQSLREHLYPQQRQQSLLQQQLLLQKQRALAMVAAKQQQQFYEQRLKPNPYSISYSSSLRSPSQENSVISPANMIRTPGMANTATVAKDNLSASGSYTVNTLGQPTPLSGPKANPYGVSRAATSGIPAIRNRAIMAATAMPPPNISKTISTIQAMRKQPKMIKDAQAAGCRIPMDNAAALLFFNSCQNSAAQMMCQAELMSCVDVGMQAMCCPYGMNKLAMDAISYVNKLQRFVSEIA